MEIKRRKTREVRIGKKAIGGENPILVQSMTTSLTSNVDATLMQIKRLEEAGCEIVRVSVFNKQDAACLGAIKKQMKVPLVADIHFDYQLGLMAMDQGVDKVRINPGNIAGGGKNVLVVGGEVDYKAVEREQRERVTEVVKKAKNKGIPLRIGVNSGSIERDLLDKYGWPSPEAMVESAMRHLEYFESLGFYDTVISLKATDVITMVTNYRLMAKRCDYPLHLGVTEAGLPGYGSLKSAVGIGTLLLEGIGDTIRVSLTGDSVNEIPVAFDILKATGRRILSPELIACPECGRIQVDLNKIVLEVKERIKDCKKPIKISLLGCAVNGPGEASEADIGIAAAKGEGLIFRKGQPLRKVKESEMVDALVEEINKL